MSDGSPRSFLLVDGENIDATLGASILNRRPNPDERPRWDRLRDHVGDTWAAPARLLFFLNASRGVPMTFVQALVAIGYRPVLLSGPSDVKVVDLAIQRTLDAIGQRETGDVLLASHDGEFAPHLERLLQAGRRVGVLGFRELISGALADLGVELYDLEDDVGAFAVALPRLRVVAIEDFDPRPLLE
jgi:putative heme uptake system protein